MRIKTMKQYKDSFAKNVYKILHEYDLKLHCIINANSDYSNTFCGIDGFYYHLCYLNSSRHKRMELFITRRDKPFNDVERPNECGYSVFEEQCYVKIRDVKDRPNYESTDFFGNYKNIDYNFFDYKKTCYNYCIYCNCIYDKSHNTNTKQHLKNVNTMVVELSKISRMNTDCIKRIMEFVK